MLSLEIGFVEPTTPMASPQPLKKSYTANRLVSEQRYYLSRVRYLTCGLDETFQFTCTLGRFDTNLTCVEALLDATITQRSVYNQPIQCGDLNVAVLSVRNKIPTEFEVSSRDVKSVFSVKELNNLSHVLPIIRAKMRVLNSLNLSEQYFNLVSQYAGEADWSAFSNFVKARELDPTVISAVLEYCYIFRKTVNLQLLYRSRK